MTENLYKKTDNLSALITAQPQLLLTLSHFGIPMGFGDKTIAQVCAEHDVDPQFFLLICEVYSNDNYFPSAATLRATPMEGLVPYLLRSHDYYLNRRLPHIGHHLEKIANMLPTRAGNAIKQFFNAYIEEVREHFAHEEKTVYPHISNLLAGESDNNFKNHRFKYSLNKQTAIKLPKGIKKFGFSVRPEEIHPHSPDGSFWGVTCFCPILDFDIGKGTNLIEINLPNINDSFFEQYYVVDEYVRVENNKLYWKGEVYIKR